MSDCNPKVSIIVNCHNGEKFLVEALDSIYMQDYSDWEIIFWDNGSDDSSADIAKSYGSHLKYYRTNEVTTLGAARKAAVDVCAGTWIGFLDTDDIWHADKLSSQLKELENSHYVLGYAGIEEINSAGEKIRNRLPSLKSGELLEQLLFQYEINMVTPLIRRSILIEHCLNFDPNITASEEFNLFLRISAKGPILVQQAILGKYRVHAGSLTDKNISKWAYERFYTLDQLKRENPGIQDRYAKAFDQSYARGEYYKACYLASKNNFDAVRKTMNSIKAKSGAYKILYLVSFFPWLWHALHYSKRHGLLGSLLSYMSFGYVK